MISAGITLPNIKDPWLADQGETLDEVFGVDPDRKRTFNSTYHEAHQAAAQRGDYHRIRTDLQPRCP